MNVKLLLIECLCPPTNLCEEALTPSAVVFKDGAQKEAVKVKRIRS